MNSVRKACEPFPETEKINASSFYGNYYGHKVHDLEHLYYGLSDLNPASKFIFLAGDSSLDNKHWFSDTSPSINGYQHFIYPPLSRQDVTFWINDEIINRGMQGEMAAINCAVEESRIESRSCSTLLPQDIFLRDHIKPNDILVISVGGNDIALRPNLCTIINMLLLVGCSSKSCIENYSCGSFFPCNEYLAGCSFACLSSFLAFPPGLGYFLHLFCIQLESYILQLLGKERPNLILACMIYYLDESPSGGWADNVLSILGYDTKPQKLQSIIRKVFEYATKRIRIPGSQVIAVPLFNVLDGKCTSDYVARVEPSASGGKKMAAYIMDVIMNKTADDTVSFRMDGR